jgi:hypothetical protein
MAKFKRFDPRNKKIYKEKRTLTKDTGRGDKLSHHMMTSFMITKRKYEEKDIYSYTEEIEL